MFRFGNKAKEKHKTIDKYLEISDRINAPILIEDDTIIEPIDKPFAFIQPQFIEIEQFDDTDEFTLQISNAGNGLLIISDISADVQWIKIGYDGDKKVLEYSDKPLSIKIDIERERLPAGENIGNITIHAIQDDKITYQIPVTVNIPKDESATIIASTNFLDFGSVTINKEVEFVFVSEIAETVYLQGDFTNWELGRIPMKKEGNKFRVVIPLEDGEYLYQFCVGDREFTDPNNQQKVILGEHGSCSKLNLNRYTLPLIIANVAPKSQKIKLIPSENINLSEYEFTLGKGEKRQIDVFLIPYLMQIGTNQGQIVIETRSRQVDKVQIQAKGIAYGPVSIISPPKVSLGTVYRGSEISALLKIKNNGNEILIGNIVVDVPWLKPMKFEIPAGAEADIAMPVFAENLEAGQYKTLISIISNDVIYGKDISNIPIEFQLVSMEVEPKEIDFGNMWIGEPKGQNIWVRRSDGAKMELSMPSELPSWLSVNITGRQTMNISIDWDKIYLDSDRDIETTIYITDRKSPLRESVHIRGRIQIPHIAVDEIDFGNGDWKKKTLPMSIKNMGNGKLVLYKIEISEDQRWMSLQYKKRKKRPPEFMLTVNRRFIPKNQQDIPLTGVIKIYSNDPIEPILNVFVTLKPR
ncbi:TPA: hypothetical protein ENX78_06415 [Candidatus Poribacteria bacterium]|nr:hypothetical protein [Candidatus Poribacteria bacterium]